MLNHIPEQEEEEEAKANLDLAYDIVSDEEMVIQKDKIKDIN